MTDFKKYCGIIPAFYACYDENTQISPQRTQDFTNHLIEKGVKGVYVCGSSGECIYLSKEERKKTLENVMAVAKGKITVIAHVACNNTADSMELAAHAQSLGVDAIAAIPPIYFHLPEHSIAKYWNDISAAAPNTDFIIYNIPQLAGVALTTSLYSEMLKNPRVIGVKNSSMPTQDIQIFKTHGGENTIVFNGPDEQFISGLAMGANGGIGGTYATMPQLFIKLMQLFNKGEMAKALEIQNDIDKIIYGMCACKGNLYAIMKAIIKINDNIDIGSVKAPLSPVFEEDKAKIEVFAKQIRDAVEKYSKY